MPVSIATLPEEHRYRLLIEAVTDYAIYMLDAEGIVTSWNPGAQRFKGYTADEIIGQHFSRFYVDEDRAHGLPARALKMAADCGKFEGEGWRVRKDGTQFWAQVVIDPIKAQDGQIIGYAKITRDLTERREADLQLRRTQEQFRLLVQGVTDYAIYMLDREGKVVSWNVGAERIKGYRPDEIIGRSFDTFYRPEDREHGDPKRALAIVLGGQRFESEGWRVRKDGSHFWANVVMDPVFDDAGQIIGVAKVTRDVTEKRKTQEALAIAQASLFQSQKLDAIGQLTGGVAHDFNNLLMVILSSLRLIDRRAGGDDPLVKKWVETAISATQRGASLTQRMLAFARRQELKPDRVDIAKLVEGMTELLRRSIGPTISLSVDIPADLPPAYVDENQLELALLNLAVNARDAMPDGGPIRIEAAKEEVSQAEGKLLPGVYVRLGVKDVGEGMDAQTLTRAMEPFFTTKGVGKGTGLGLSMVEGVASQSGGQLILKSRVGEGTTAEIWLPIAAAEPEPASLDAVLSPDHPSPHCGMNGSALNVILVDDDPLVLDSTVALLQDMGHLVTSSNSALEALQVFRKGHKFDLIITDQAMPGMTGTELLAVVKSLQPDIISIIATGYVETGAVMAIPADALRLNKPFNQEQLARSLEVAASACRRA
ncbi:MAG TPA: PAS domain S-box protein [Burkholderiaceae bacterium]|jgi:PAS domain S-box-containing protein